MKKIPLLVLSSLPFLLGACGGGGTTEARPALPLAVRKEASQVFHQICVTCHGSEGRGDGPGAAALTPKPRAFSDVKWQASVTDAHIKKAITNGGAAVGKSPQMPAQPQLKGKEQLLDGLVGIVRSFARR